MSLLPQRKKSAEEIAKIRESFGLPGDALAGSAAELATAEEEPQEEHHYETRPASPPSRPAEVDLSASFIATPHTPRPVHSLRKSESIGQATQPELTQLSDAHAAPDPSSGPQRRPLKSLRKSEQGPLPSARIASQASASNLPQHRHSEREIEQLRRQTILQNQAPTIHPAALTVHFSLLIIAYLGALIAAISYHFYDVFIAIPACLIVISLMIAGFIFFKKPASRHHAAFLAAIAGFVIIFGAFHYFPQLIHGS
jgi:hypothetical protein